jgi:hypothetical protein
MRSKLSVLAASAALALTAHAAIDLGNGVKVVPNVITSVDFNDNLFLASTDEQDETLIRVSPGIVFSMGEGALNTAQFSYNEEFQFYSDQSDLNTSLSLVDFSSSYDDAKMKIDVAAWWHEANQATRDTPSVAGLVKRELLHGAITDEVTFSQKSSVKVGIIYDDTDYSRATYTDWQWVEIPVQYFYEVQPKLDASLGLRYRQNTVDRLGADSDEFFYNVGVRGELTPKLSGEVQVGYIQLKPDAGDTQDAFGLKAGLTFAFSPKTNFYFDANNEFGYSAAGDSYQTGGAAVRFDTALNTNVLLRGRAFWNNYDYITSGQNDDYYGGQFAGTYTFNEHAEVTASYTYTNNDSNRPTQSFTNSIFSVSATLKY